MKLINLSNTHNTTLSRRRLLKWIVIHFTAGVHSRPGAAANVAAWFKNPSCAASADFICDDATSVQYNPDIRNRYSWAVGGSLYKNSKGGSLYGTVTNRNSISVEVCSTSATGKVLAPNASGWSFTDAVIDQAVELTRYLMAEYGIDTDHVIRHYDVTGKWCPGIIGWNKESGSEAAWQKFKARLANSTQPAAVSVSPVAKYDSTEKTIWDFLMDKGLSNYAAAGVMGNLYAESSLRPNNLQDSAEKKLELTDAEYTESVDSGDYDNFANDKAGYGLCQWTWWSRKEALFRFARETSRSIGDLTMQLEYLWYELKEDFPSTLSALTVAASVQEASNAFLFQFEAPADKSEAVQKQRAGFGQVYYDKYALPYYVSVSVEKLNIRKKPGTDADCTIVGSITGGPTVYTIVEVQGSWGRLKSGAGWIYLPYTQRAKLAA
ncbi:MAG: N-acetylmuramoyl-L-alanine amidase [Oscillibacter sp.]|nr:N-acetylmuramoyl-L-alanine amidase [Oscillibacter sp.]